VPSFAPRIARRAALLSLAWRTAFRVTVVSRVDDASGDRRIEVDDVPVFALAIMKPNRTILGDPEAEPRRCS
jgi:hypothetical protein